MHRQLKIDYVLLIATQKYYVLKNRKLASEQNPAWNNFSSVIHKELSIFFPDNCLV